MKKVIMIGILFFILFVANATAQQLDIQLSGYGSASTYVSMYGSTTAISLSTKWEAYLDGMRISDADFYRIIGDRAALDQEERTLSAKRKFFWGGLLATSISLIARQLYQIQYEKDYEADPGNVDGSKGDWTTFLMIGGVSSTTVGLFMGNGQIRPAVYAIRKAEEINKK